MHLDEIDKRLLNLTQRGFPLAREPYAEMGAWLGTDGPDMLCRIKRLKQDGVIRHIGPVLDPASLGYQTTLVAARIGAHRLDKAARIISRMPSVSHCYQRDHDFNLWFTLAWRTDIQVQEELQELSDLIGAEVLLNLPAIRVFKIWAFFDIAREGIAADSANNGRNHRTPTKSFSAEERKVINALQQDLPLVESPFDSMSESAGMGVDEFLHQCRCLVESGVVRRFAASVRHDKVGFVANAMACWRTTPDLAERAGHKLATFREVSHCYERRASPLWPYNLFAMIHGHTKEACNLIADRVTDETDLKDRALLFSTREFKKARIRYET